eukprot:4683722-Prymnesium_polylepis.1
MGDGVMIGCILHCVRWVWVLGVTLGPRCRWPRRACLAWAAAGAPSPTSLRVRRRRRDATPFALTVCRAMPIVWCIVLLNLSAVCLSPSGGFAFGHRAKPRHRSEI